jgi:hypothetical protein
LLGIHIDARVATILAWLGLGRLPALRGLLLRLARLGLGGRLRATLRLHALLE